MERRQIPLASSLILAAALALAPPPADASEETFEAIKVEALSASM